MEDVWKGLADCYMTLVQDVRTRHGLWLDGVAALGFSAMMHGYVALDDQGELLVPFRTWRNNITGAASGLLTQALDFPVPQRWSVAHLYQSVLEDQPHLPRLAHLTTLAGYVHWRLTGERVLGVGDASGMFPIDAAEADWDAARLAAFDALVGPRGLPWTLRGVIPSVLRAGRPAGRLSRRPVSFSASRLSRSSANFRKPWGGKSGCSMPSCTKSTSRKSVPKVFTLRRPSSCKALPNFLANTCRSWKANGRGCKPASKLAAPCKCCRPPALECRELLPAMR
jgi:hypothetical protein